MSTFTKILVPIDFSACSAKALHTAREIAARYDAPLTLVNVWQPPQFARADLMVLAHSKSLSLGEYGQQEAKAQFQRFLVENQASDLPHQVVLGDPRAKIVEIAERDGYDLIVMGTHGRSGRVRALAGSVAETVVRRAPCAVMTVRAED